MAWLKRGVANNNRTILPLAANIFNALKKFHIISLILISVLDDDRDETITRINSKLPSCIKVHSIKKVTKNFNSKSQADARTYLYFLPTFAFAPLVPINDKAPGENDAEFDYKASSEFRMSESTRQRVNEVLKEFLGSKYYHNYTSGK